MGYFPKSVRRARQHRNLNLIANAALAGCRFERSVMVQGSSDFVDGNLEMYQKRSIHWRATIAPNHGVSPWSPSKARAAASYMAWLEREGRL